MYGPLVMGTTGIDNWDDATVTLDDNLANVIAIPPTTEDGAYGNLYTLTLDDHTFIPDYALDCNQTHYLRIAHTSRNDRSDGFDAKELQELLLIAKERKLAQEAWYALTTKIPEHAPWAPHGYARLIEQYIVADSLNNLLEESEMTDDSIALHHLSIANLNAAINTMRPGNLAEPEDLEELLSLLTRAKLRYPCLLYTSPSPRD